VDFAYAVHTDVGNTCIAAKIDRRLAPLRTALLNGQTVEIITAPGAHPNPSWLNFAVTGKARSNIRHYLKNLHTGEAVSLGRRLLDKALLSIGVVPAEVSEARLLEIAVSYGLKSADDLLEDIGLGNRMPMLAARRLQAGDEIAEPVTESGAMPSGGTPLAIRGTEGMVVSFAKCCRPIPGDRIAGFVSAGRGIIIHTETCKTIADYRNRPEKWVDVEWERDVSGEFSVELRVDVANQRGVLATVAAAIADMGSNIENVGIEERDGLNSTLAFTVTVRDRQHLARVMRRIRHIPLVLRISRTKS
jgi:(p)ppGpp synthase/HD superfamily hydrolase